MKTAIYFRSISPSLYSNFDELFSLTKRLGFDGIELACDTKGLLSIDSTKEECEEIKRLANKHEVTLPSLSGGAGWDVHILSDDNEEREHAKSVIRKMIKVAHYLETRVLLVCPGQVGPFLSGPSYIENYEEAFNRAILDYQDLAVFAEQNNVIIGLENVWSKFLMSPMEMRMFVDSIGSDFVGVYFDTGNATKNGYAHHWIDILGKRIKAVHFKDFVCNIGNLYGFVELLQGDVDFELVMKSLQRINYRGWLTVEQTPTKHFPEEMLVRIKNSMDKVLQLLN